MGWFNWLGKREPTGNSLLQKAFLKRLDRSAMPTQQRDWKVTKDSDASMSHWGHANGATINDLLSMHLEKIIDRACYESRANPLVDGTISSHANDVIGPSGPALQFQTDDDKWNKRAEEIWLEISQSIDGSGELSLADFLKQGVRSLWTKGAIVSQYVYDADCDSIVKQRLHSIPVELLYSGKFNTTDTMLGITRNKLGRPIKYWVNESGLRVESMFRSIKPVDIPASEIQHVYCKQESQQWRGYPWLSSSLQAIAELDEYDTAVLDAAKVAAMMAVLFFNTKDDIESDEDPKNFEIKRQSGVKVPTGWQPFALNSNQPTSSHAAFKSDKIRDIGRPVGMPLMSIQRDASNHTYSSARFDGQGYARANESIQYFIEQKAINPFIGLVLMESMLRGVLPYKEPRTLIGKWNCIWTKPPQVDPVKEAMAQRLQLENRTLSPQRACLENNVDFETVCKEWKKANEILVANGLPKMMGPIPTDPNALAAIMANANDQENQPNQQVKK
jgi:lambda family phage portal protein